MQWQAVFVLLLDELVGSMVRHAGQAAPSVASGYIASHKEGP